MCQRSDNCGSPDRWRTIHGSQPSYQPEREPTVYQLGDCPAGELARDPRRLIANGDIEVSQARHTPPAAKKREPLLAIPDVAEILKVSEKQVRRYIADPDPRKRLPSIKIGRLIRIDPSDLENFIRDRRWP